MSLLLSTRRRIVQFASFILLTTNVRSVSIGGNFCLPIMHCEACVWSWFMCPVGMMSSSIAFHEFPWLVLAITLGVGVILGRFLCGWVCPLGLLQDLLHRVPSPKLTLPRFLSWTKYAVLAISVVAVSYWFGKEPLGFFCNYCPTATLEVVLPSMILWRDFAMDPGRILRFSVLALVLVAAVVNHRSFCKVLCPIGALVAITNRFSFLTLRLRGDSCVHCHKCDRSCPMDVPVEKCSESGRAINRDTECIECLTCEAVCPTRAISNNSRVLARGDRP